MPTPEAPARRRAEHVAPTTRHAARRPTLAAVARTAHPAGPTSPATGRAWTWRTAVVAVLLAYAAYALARLAGAGGTGPALENAARVVDLERALGIAVEGGVQRALDAPAPIWVFNHLYLAAQFAVVPGVLLLVRRRSRAAFRRLRDTLLITWLLAAPVNALFPVAPPRMAGIGIADTITASGSDALTSGLTTTFYNPLAAVPSLHVAFALAVGVAAATTFRSPAVRALGLAWGPIVALTVVATGNHYVFDAAAGALVVAAGFALAGTPWVAGTRPTPDGVPRTADEATPSAASDRRVCRTRLRDRCAAQRGTGA